MSNYNSTSPALTEAYTLQNQTNEPTASGFFAIGNTQYTHFSVPSASWKFQTVSRINQQKGPSALPKQLPRCERKVLQAVAMASSAETTVLIIRSSTLAISAARRGGERKNEKDGEVACSILESMSICIWTKTFVNQSM